MAASRSTAVSGHCSCLWVAVLAPENQETGDKLLGMSAGNLPFVGTLCQAEKCPPTECWSEIFNAT